MPDGPRPALERLAARQSHRAAPRLRSITIRRAIPSDASALSELAARTFAETFAADNTPEDLEAHLRSSYGVAQQSAEIRDPDVVTLLARVDDGLVGFAVAGGLGAQFAGCGLLRQVGIRQGGQSRVRGRQ